MDALIIIQARMGSTRFPGKSLAEIGGRPILWYLFRQIAHCRAVDKAVLATTSAPADEPLAAYAEAENWLVFRGSEADVLDRYYHAALAHGATDETPVVRLTGDDILPDPNLIDALIGVHAALWGRVDFVTMDRSGRIPYGAGVELFPFRALATAHRDARDPADREHVSRYIHRNPDLFRRIDIIPDRAYDCAPLSIDTPADLARNARLLECLERNGKPPFTLGDVLDAEAALTREAAP